MRLSVLIGIRLYLAVTFICILMTLRTRNSDEGTVWLAFALCTLFAMCAKLNYRDQEKENRL